MGEGLKRHTHLEREAIVAALVPLIIRHMGHQLVALGVGGSFARDTDGPYSDLELIGFVKKTAGPRAVVRFVHDGMGVDIWFLTRQEFLDDHKSNVRATWPYTATAMLRPLINDAFIHELNATPFNSRTEDRKRVLGVIWPLVQEAVAKLLNATAGEDPDPVPYLYWQVVEKFCVALSILNARPFTTRAAAFRETRAFAILPAGFESLLIPPGEAVAGAELARRALLVFEEIERLLLLQGLELQAQRLDAFVRERTFGQLLRESLHVDRFTHKAAKLRRRVRSRLGARTTEP